ncbi:MAG TPA: hypothetical protein ENK63_05275 [Rhodobacterales bacterium]|nr:hypothetical protein [Rhodobacterales bacterium]
MGKPVIVVAGQSNVYRVADEIKDALEEKFGANTFHFVKVYEPGAPLTWARGAQDWATQSELPDRLFDDTAAALRADPGSYLGGVIWLQGEADTYGSANADAYANTFLALFEQFRARLSNAFAARDINADHAEVVISELSNHAPAAPDRPNWDTIIATHETLANQARISSVDPDAVAAAAGLGGAQMFSDGLHYATEFSGLLAGALVDTLAQTLEGKITLRTGTDGDDRFNAIAGPDEMVGGAGNDVYVVDDPGDLVVEMNGQGRDLVLAWVDTVLWQHNQATEVLKLMGHDDLSAKGNKLDNTVIGNDGDNLLNGAWGNDVLRGGKGNDVFVDDHGQERMIGGRGNDLYVVDDPGDSIIERAGAGWDSVESTITLRLSSLSQNLEQLTLTGSGDISGFGNKQANRIIGNGGDNRLNGGRGNDRLFGNDGNDVLTDRSGNDQFSGGAGSDTFVFRGRFGQDTITDFDPKDPGEKIDLSQVGSIRDFNDLADNHLHAQGDDTLILAAHGQSILLQGVSLADLNADNFLF